MSYNDNSNFMTENDDDFVLPMVEEKLTPEQIHDISPQPSFPSVDEVYQIVVDLQRQIKGYERYNEEELIRLIQDIEYELSNLVGYGKSGLLEDIIDKTSEIVCWGYEWRRCALKLHKQLE